MRNLVIFSVLLSVLFNPAASLAKTVYTTSPTEYSELNEDIPIKSNNKWLKHFVIGVGIFSVITCGVGVALGFEYNKKMDDIKQDAEDIKSDFINEAGFLRGFANVGTTYAFNRDLKNANKKINEHIKGEYDKLGIFKPLAFPAYEGFKYARKDYNPKLESSWIGKFQ